MTTVLIILLAYPIATVVLNILTCAMMSYMLRKESKLMALLRGISLRFVLYPFWLKYAGTIACSTFWTTISMIRR